LFFTKTIVGVPYAGSTQRIGEEGDRYSDAVPSLLPYPPRPPTPPPLSRLVSGCAA